MAVTPAVQEANGAGPSWTTKTTIRFCTDDEHNPLLTYPIPIPAASQAYSYWKHISLQFNGTFTSAENIRHYCDGTIAWTLGTLGEVRRGNRDAGDHGCPSGNYEISAGTQGTTGYSIEDVTNGHDYYNAQTTKTADLTSDTAPEGATIDSNTYTTPADRSYSIVLQVMVDNDATQGAQAAETFTWKWDEI